MKTVRPDFAALLVAMSLGLGTVMATPAYADQPDRRNDNRREYRNDQRAEQPRASRNNQQRNAQRNNRNVQRTPAYRPRGNVNVVHVYDYNRPDPRYRGYYANNYYRGGYAPLPINRSSRIYRGNDNRYYCRRSDGTTGLIVGAALGGVIGNRLDQGQSGVLGTLLGAGAGALLGREIDRGDIVCR